MSKKRKRIKRKEFFKNGFNINPILFSFIILLLFLIPFFISYYFTFKHIKRKEAVSIKEEAEFLQNKIVSEEELNNLYRNYKKDNNQVLILGYHQIRNIDDKDTEKEKLFITSPRVFEEEMKYLKDNNYISISITDYINYLKDNIRNPIPKKSIIITFDDGYATQYQNAFPILKKYNMKATFFIYADCIDIYPVCMTKENLIDLVNNNMKLGNHTYHHVYLTDYKYNTIKKEIVDNQKFIESFGKNNAEKILAYPYGLVDSSIIEALKELNYFGGVGVSFFTKDNKDIYNLPRYLLGDNIQNFYDILN